jgi:hypothetical protein
MRAQTEAVPESRRFLEALFNTILDTSSFPKEKAVKIFTDYIYRYVFVAEAIRFCVEIGQYPIAIRHSTEDG